MAEIDPSIILNAKTDYGSSIDTAAKAMTLKHLMKQDAMNEKLMPLQQEAAQLDLDAKKTAMDEQEAIKGVFQNSYDPTTNKFDKMKASSGLYKVSPKFAQEWMTKQAEADQAFAKQLRDTHKNFVGVAGPLSKRAVDEYDKRVAAGMPEEIAWQQVQPMVASSMSMLESSGYGPEFTGGDASKLDIDTLRGVANQWDGSLKLDQERATAEATADYRDKSLAERSRATDAQERRAAALENGVMAPPKPPVGYRYSDADGQTLEPIPGGPADPSKVKPTEGQATAGGFADRMAAATGRMESVLTENPQFDPSNLKDHAANAIPGGNYVQSDAYQLYRQAQEDWVRAKLRKESGAAIGVKEMDDEIRNYFPQPGDGKDVIKQKAAARATAEQAMGKLAGPAGSKTPGGESVTVKWDELPP